MKEKLNYLLRAGPVLVICLCALLFVGSQASAVIIDHFDDGDCTITLTYNSGSLPMTSGVKDLSGTVNLIQGHRDVELTITGPASGGSGDSVLALDQNALASILRWDEADALVGKLILGYHGSGSDFSPEVDLTVGGESYFVFRYGTDAHTADLTIDVYSAGGHSQLSGVTLPSTVATNVMTTTLFSFASFSAVGTAADFTAVEELKFTIDSTGQSGGDYYFDLIGTAVPEPVTMLGMFLGLGSIGAYIRRRRMK